MAVLNHPKVMSVYDVSFSDRMQSIVMEYIDGITLKEYIEQTGDPQMEGSGALTVQTLRALQHAHDKGIVHRDIKPQNIMLLSVRHNQDHRFRYRTVLPGAKRAH
jgi:serine/threonine-protein kinase